MVRILPEERCPDFLVENLTRGHNHRESNLLCQHRQIHDYDQGCNDGCGILPLPICRESLSELCRMDSGISNIQFAPMYATRLWLCIIYRSYGDCGQDLGKYWKLWKSGSRNYNGQFSLWESGYGDT